jgi:hypothetical protein
MEIFQHYRQLLAADIRHLDADTQLLLIAVYKTV